MATATEIPMRILIQGVAGTTGTAGTAGTAGAGRRTFGSSVHLPSRSIQIRLLLPATPRSTVAKILTICRGIADATF